jgi:maltooligosyltrehalose trehalohydrolase
LTGELDGYYQDYGTLGHLAKALAQGYVYSGQYSAFRQRRHGNSSRAVAAQQLVVCAQNHDQIGNRLRGERLTALVSFEHLKLAAGAVLLSPFIPLLFMGEEYGEPAPFPYFVSHTDEQLIEAVRKGRREEFASFGWAEEAPDPQSPDVFDSAKLHHDLRQSGDHAVLYTFYQTLMRLRRSTPSLARLDKDRLDLCAFEADRVIWMRRRDDHEESMIGFNFSPHASTLAVPWTLRGWQKRLDSAATEWHGPGSEVPMQLDDPTCSTLTLPPLSVVLFTRRRQENEV